MARANAAPDDLMREARQNVVAEFISARVGRAGTSPAPTTMAEGRYIGFV